MSDANLFATIRERLFTAVIGDVMDAAGLTRQFLPPEIRALQADSMVVGRAMTVLEADTEYGQDAGFGLMFRALDDLKPGEVYVCTGASPAYALWGGLMSARAMSLGAVGAVVDGHHRDTREILGLGFPVFSAGAYAQDQRLRGRVVDYRRPITFRNGCAIASGDHCASAAMRARASCSGARASCVRCLATALSSYSTSGANQTAARSAISFSVCTRSRSAITMSAGFGPRPRS